MASTTFVDSQTPILAAWLNDVNDFVYAGQGPSGFTLSLLTYADNTAAIAGGLVVGQLYKTSTGQVMVVY